MPGFDAMGRGQAVEPVPVLQVGGKRRWSQPIVLRLNPASNMPPGSPCIDVVDRGCQRLRDMAQEDWPDELVRCRQTLAAQVLADQVVLAAQVLAAERRLEPGVVEDAGRYSPGEFRRSHPEAPTAFHCIKATTLSVVTVLPWLTLA